MNKKKLSGAPMLLLTAMIWGGAFVAQSMCTDYVGPFTFNTARYTIGAAVLIPIIFIADKLNPGRPAELGWRNPKLWIAGVICGFLIAIAAAFQQAGIQYTTVGKAGFITTLYVILVPIFTIFLGKKPSKLIWVCVVLAVCGLYLLCMSETASINFGDLLVLCSGLGFAIQILVVDHYVMHMDGVKLSFLQFLFSAIFSLVPAFLFETPTVSGLVGAWMPLFYTGVLSCGVGYTFQILGQQNTDPTVASIVMCMESVFSVIFGWLILHQALSPRELMGCALMFVAVLLAQLPSPKEKEAQKAIQE